MIALITDFGIDGSFVAAMKAVIYSINSNVKIIDITHSVSPQNVKEARFHLESCYKFFPKGTIFLCLVDPEVGSSRKAIIVKTDDYFFLAPNNGLLSQIIKEHKNIIIYDLSSSFNSLKNISNTFHGRDIFAPAAAYISLDPNYCNSLKRLAPSEIKLIESPVLEKLNESTFKTEIQHIDRFGNLISSIPEKYFQNIDMSSIKIKYKSKVIKCLFLKSYSDAGEGKFLAYIGSSGFLEIAIRNGNAKNEIGCEPNEIIEVEIY